jgi:uncharacterized protein YukJ
MPIGNYGVLKGKARDERKGQGKSPHFNIMVAGKEMFRIAFNVKS